MMQHQTAFTVHTTINGQQYVDGKPVTMPTTKLLGVPVCPDLLAYSDIGAPDNLRGRVVRGFFWLLRWWRP